MSATTVAVEVDLAVIDSETLRKEADRRGILLERQETAIDEAIRAERMGHEVTVAEWVDGLQQAERELVRFNDPKRALELLRETLREMEDWKELIE